MRADVSRRISSREPPRGFAQPTDGFHLRRAERNHAHSGPAASRRKAGARQEHAPPPFGSSGEARARSDCGCRAARFPRAAHGADRASHSPQLARAGLLPPEPHGPSRPSLRHHQIPQHGGARGRRDDRAGHEGRRAHDAHRPHPAQDQPRRAAAALQRAHGRDVARRAAPACDRARPPLRRAHRQLCTAPARKAGNHRLGAGERRTRRHARRSNSCRHAFATTAGTPSASASRSTCASCSRRRSRSSARGTRTDAAASSSLCRAGNTAK